MSTFEYDGQRIPLMDRQRGIREPALINAALSIDANGVHPAGRDPANADAEGFDGLQRYKYRRDEPRHPENRALRRAYEDGLPLIWFVGVPDGVYKVRLHQPMFRARVLAAYRSRCTVCRLRHSELLDAAHINADTRPHGGPVVPNGLALCKIHHAAFDSDITGVRPDLAVHIRRDVLEETDGPMLRHGLQGMHNSRLTAPRARDARPDAERLEERYADFLAR